MEDEVELSWPVSVTVSCVCHFSMVTSLLLTALVLVSSLGTVKGNCIQVDPKDLCYDSYIKFYMFTRDGILELSFKQAAPFVLGIPIILLLHDTGGNITTYPIIPLARAYLNRNVDFNVLAVNYPALSNPSCPKESAANVAYIGRCTSHFITELMHVASVDLSDVHLVGFGLGAQVAALCAFYLQKPLGRITGLDPALAGFPESLNDSYRLDRSDAVFVDVLHTNTGVMGISYLAGHADYYVSNNPVAPGCQSPDIPVANFCSHTRSAEYFLESLFSQQPVFFGTPCTPGADNQGNSLQSYKELKQMAVMGEQATRWSSGVFCVPVNPNYPYGQGPPLQ